MTRKILSLIILGIMLSASSVLAENVAPESTKVDEQNIGNKILKSEYPDAKNILPVVEEETETKVIEGSVEKSIDIISLHTS